MGDYKETVCSEAEILQGLKQNQEETIKNVKDNMDKAAKLGILKLQKNDTFLDKSQADAEKLENIQETEELDPELLSQERSLE
jgi:hypothetical protein